MGLFEIQFQLNMKLPLQENLSEHVDGTVETSQLETSDTQDNLRTPENDPWSACLQRLSTYFSAEYAKEKEGIVFVKEKVSKMEKYKLKLKMQKEAKVKNLEDKRRRREDQRLDEIEKRKETHSLKVKKLKEIKLETKHEETIERKKLIEDRKLKRSLALKAIRDAKRLKFMEERKKTADTKRKELKENQTNVKTESATKTCGLRTVRKYEASTNSKLRHYDNDFSDYFKSTPSLDISDITLRTNAKVTRDML